ncbi:MAG TPA: ISNCY family transposase [Candidatus Tectomicrobia bacterium]|nr:ISNCY family transposase [Candidatus Tectomicrobia bacterium]
MAVVAMSEAELARVGVLGEVAAGRLSVEHAAGLMDVSRRQAFRLLGRFREGGAAALASRRRGRPSNRRLPESVRTKAMALVRERYADFGPTLAAEKLSALHGLRISRETLRQWMMADGVWADRRTRAKPIHQPRGRRECLGELVQIDGSRHWWFEDRGPPCTLLVYIDDATSRLMHLEFVLSETAFDYFRATRAYMAAHGKPVAFYSDKHSIFRAAKADMTDDPVITQFGRALQELNVGIICANSPQAKGRVERANKTLQDRLVKELRLQGISTIEAANAMLPEFLADHNQRFAKPPRCPKDLHRQVSAWADVDAALTWKEDRTVSRSLTLQYNKVLFLLEASEFACSVARRRVTVFDYPDGRLEIRYAGRALPYIALDKLPHGSRPTPVVGRKELDEALGEAKAAQARREVEAGATPPAFAGPMASGDCCEAAPPSAEWHQAPPTRAVPRLPKSDFADGRLAAALAFVHEQHVKRPVKRSNSAPVRTGQANHMFGTT